MNNKVGSVVSDNTGSAKVVEVANPRRKTRDSTKLDKKTKLNSRYNVIERLRKSRNFEILFIRKKRYNLILGGRKEMRRV